MRGGEQFKVGWSRKTSLIRGPLNMEPKQGKGGVKESQSGSQGPNYLGLGGEARVLIFIPNVVRSHEELRVLGSGPINIL